MASPKLYQVIVIDDDMRRQLHIKNMTDWHALSCEIVAFAQNNKDAYRLYREVRPDIILLGVRGKRLDRVPLIHQIRREDEQVQILLLMESFSYDRVRSYIRSGIDDLLLFPLLRKEGLQAAITQAKGKADRQTRRHDAIMEGVIRELQQCLLLRKEDHSSEVQDFAQVLSHPFYDFIRQGALMAYLRIDQIHLIHHQRKIDRKHLRRQIEQILNDHHMAYPDALPLFLNQHSVILLFPTKDVTQTLFAIRTLHAQMQQLLNYGITIILGEPFTKAQEMMEQFDRLLACSRNRFYEKEQILLLKEVTPAQFQRLQPGEVHFHQELSDAALAQDFQRVRAIQSDMLDYMEEHCILPSDVLAYCTFVAHNVEGREITYGMKQQDFPFADVAAIITMCETLAMLREEMEQIWTAAEVWTAEKNRQRYRRNVGEWLEFIHNNLHRPLSLKEVAAHFQVSPSYASRLFKQEVGKTMISYINEERMKEALRLLNESNLSVREIALRIGYADPYYFDRLFRRYHAMTPREYRNRLRKPGS